MRRAPQLLQAAPRNWLVRPRCPRARRAFFTSFTSCLMRSKSSGGGRALGSAAAMAGTRRLCDRKRVREGAALVADWRRTHGLALAHATAV
jgi:hypothetical protein